MSPQNMYEVRLYANLTKSDIYHYRQWYEAYLCSDEWQKFDTIEIPDYNNPLQVFERIVVLQRKVVAVSGKMAIRKFKIWQNKGLDEVYLMDGR